ncbi:MAG: hypothetical protein ACXWCM_13045 [Acidimicrobiales bacterium]
MSTIRRLTSWFIVDDQDDVARMKAARDRAVREALHAEAQVRDLCEALDAAESLLRHLDRMTSHYRLGWQMGAPFVEFDDGPIDPTTLAHPAYGADLSH